MNKGEVYKQDIPEEIFKQGAYLTEIGLDLPFAMRMNYLLNHNYKYTTFEQLVNRI